MKAELVYKYSESIGNYEGLVDALSRKDFPFNINDLQSESKSSCVIYGMEFDPKLFADRIVECMNDLGDTESIYKDGLILAGQLKIEGLINVYIYECSCYNGELNPLYQIVLETCILNLTTE